MGDGHRRRASRSRRRTGRRASTSGVNLGRPAGGSVSEHLHVHVVPRWTGDSNFMTADRQHPHAARGAPRQRRQAPRRLAVTLGAPGRHAPERRGLTASTAQRPGVMLGRPSAVAVAGEHRDELPDDLDAAGYVGPVPVPGQLAAARSRRCSTSSSPPPCVVVWLVGGDSSPIVNEGWLWAAARCSTVVGA